MKARHCDECRYWQNPKSVKHSGCDKGHRPRFYVPKRPNDLDWGWKRRCEDFREIGGRVK